MRKIKLILTYTYVIPDKNDFYSELDYLKRGAPLVYKLVSSLTKDEPVKEINATAHRATKVKVKASLSELVLHEGGDEQV